MERLYLSITGESCTIHHRPTHEFICTCSVSEAKQKVKEMLKMDIKEFYKYLVNSVPFIRLQGKKNIRYNASSTDSEDWYKKAWLAGTNAFLKKNKLVMVDEDQPLEYIDQLLEEKKKAQAGQSAFRNIVDEEEKWHETEELKRPARKLIKKSEPKEDITDIEEIEEAEEKPRRTLQRNKERPNKKLIRKHR